MNLDEAICEMSEEEDSPLIKLDDDSDEQPRTFLILKDNKEIDEQVKQF
jgi:hypothetical protein